VAKNRELDLREYNYKLLYGTHHDTTGVGNKTMNNINVYIIGKGSNTIVHAHDNDNVLSVLSL